MLSVHSLKRTCHTLFHRRLHRFFPFHFLVATFFTGVALLNAHARHMLPHHLSAARNNYKANAIICSAGGNASPQADTAGNIPRSVRLKVDNIPQMPELPNGCEGVSLTIVLNYLGFNADKMDIAYNYIPLQPFYYNEDGQLMCSNPENAYPGAPGVERTGYYCYPTAVVAAAEKYFNHQNEDFYNVHNATGASLETIFKHLANRSPVIIWKTLYNTPPQQARSFSWVDNQTNERYIPYINIHVAVITGFDQEYIYLSDPLEIYDRLSWEAFESTFNACGQKAVVIATKE